MFFQKKEFNVKVIHTKLSSNSGASHATTSKQSSDDTFHTAISVNPRQSLKIDSGSTNVIQNFIANIFFREVNLVLYDDSKDQMYKKNNIASIFFDDFIVCYVEEVCFDKNTVMNFEHFLNGTFSVLKISGKEAGVWIWEYSSRQQSLFNWKI